MWHAGAPQAIPTMCILVVKLNEHGDPDYATSRVVVLGNQECRMRHKHECAAPVIRQSSVHLLVSSKVSAKRKVHQGNAQNVFCNPDLLLEETMIVRPPMGDPATKEGEYRLLHKTLYWLSHSPKHWFDMIVAILLKMGLTQSCHDPCLFHGVSSSLEEHLASPGDPPITIGLYVDDFM